jgi:hypothetical protein
MTRPTGRRKVEAVGVRYMATFCAVRALRGVVTVLVETLCGQGARRVSFGGIGAPPGPERGVDRSVNGHAPGVTRKPYIYRWIEKGRVFESLFANYCKNS